jgi:short-subunit dehydrogenase
MAETRVAIVTGASSGIGAATALELARRRYAVFLAARRGDRLEQVAELCRKAGGEARVAVTDVASQQQVQALVDGAVRDFGRLDVMVNNAGFGHFGRVHETTDEQMRAIFDTNFHGLFYGAKAAALVMIAQKSGHIFNVSSVIGKRGSPFHGAYSASKFAVCGLTDSLRVEMAPYNVRVTCVCPGLTRTEFFDRVQGRSGRTGKAPFGRIRGNMDPAIVARKIVATIGKKTPELVFSTGGRFLTIVAGLWPRAADAMMRVYHDELAREL